MNKYMNFRNQLVNTKKVASIIKQETSDKLAKTRSDFVNGVGKMTALEVCKLEDEANKLLKVELNRIETSGATAKSIVHSFTGKPVTDDDIKRMSDIFID